MIYVAYRVVSATDRRTRGALVCRGFTTVAEAGIEYDLAEQDVNNVVTDGPIWLKATEGEAAWDEAWGALL